MEEEAEEPSSPAPLFDSSTPEEINSEDDDGSGQEDDNTSALADVEVLDDVDPNPTGNQSVPRKSSSKSSNSRCSDDLSFRHILDIVSKANGDADDTRHEVARLKKTQEQLKSASLIEGHVTNLAKTIEVTWEMDGLRPKNFLDVRDKLYQHFRAVATWCSFLDVPSEQNDGRLCNIFLEFYEISIADAIKLAKSRREDSIHHRLEPHMNVHSRAFFRVLWKSLTPQLQASFTRSIKDVNTSDWEDGVLLWILICHRAFPDHTDYIRVSKERLDNLTLQSDHINGDLSDFIEAYDVLMRCLPTTEADWATYVLAYFKQLASSNHKNIHVRSWASIHRTQLVSTNGQWANASAAFGGSGPLTWGLIIAESREQLEKGVRDQELHPTTPDSPQLQAMFAGHLNSRLADVLMPLVQDISTLRLRLSAVESTMDTEHGHNHNHGDRRHGGTGDGPTKPKSKSIGEQNQALYHAALKQKQWAHTPPDVANGESEEKILSVGDNNIPVYWCTTCGRRTFTHNTASHIPAGHHKNKRGSTDHGTNPKKKSRNQRGSDGSTAQQPRVYPRNHNGSRKDYRKQAAASTAAFFAQHNLTMPTGAPSADGKQAPQGH